MFRPTRKPSSGSTSASYTRLTYSIELSVRYWDLIIYVRIAIHIENVWGP